MTKYDILMQYKYEVNSENYTDIHKQYKQEQSKLSPHHVDNKLSIPTTVVIIICIVFGIACIPLDLPLPFFITVGILIITIIVKKISNAITERINVNNYKKFNNSQELQNLNDKYYREYNSVIGYIDCDGCLDYDYNNGCYYCGATGQRLSVNEVNKFYCKSHKIIDNCERMKPYWANLYD